MRSWKAEGSISTRGILLKEPFKVGTCTIFQKKDRMYITVDVRAGDQADLEDIDKLASIEVHKACLTVSLATERYFAFENFDHIAETTPSAKKPSHLQRFSVGAKLVTPVQPSARKEITGIFKLLENADSHVYKAIDYFEKGLTLSRWKEDAFLNFFKAIELISNKYSKEADPEEIRAICRKPKKELTTKDRMLFMCQKLNIPLQWSSKVSELVHKRNEQDVAHAKLSTGKINTNDVYNCEATAKLTIVNYLKKLAETP